MSDRDLGEHIISPPNIVGYIIVDGTENKTVTLTESEPNVSVVFNYTKEDSMDMQSEFSFEEV